MTVAPPPPLACNLTALMPEQRLRHAQLWKVVRTITPERTEHGLAFRCGPSTSMARDMAELASLEVLCCPFLQISVVFQPAGGPLSFELRGDEEVRTFLTAEFQPGSVSGT